MPNWTLIGSILLPNVGGWLSTLAMIGQVKKSDGTAWYQKIKKPSWTPPNWAFGPAWTVLYCCMGYAAYVIYSDCEGFTDKSMVPLALYGGQLVLNWTWTPVFFKMHRVGTALLHMIALDFAAVVCTINFYKINPSVTLLMIPYLGWLSFATCLNYAIWQLNKNNKKSN